MTFGGGFTTGIGGGGGGSAIPGDRPVHVARFDSPSPASVDGLLASTATTLAIVTYNLTIQGSHKRNIVVTLGNRVGGYAGPWTLSGTIDGAAATESLTIPANGGADIVGKKCFDPGPITLARPAQLATDGTVRVGLGDAIGLPYTALQNSATGNTGYIVFFALGGALGYPGDGLYGTIDGPSVAGGKGSYKMAAGSTIDGSALAIGYVGVSS